MLRPDDTFINAPCAADAGEVSFDALMRMAFPAGRHEVVTWLAIFDGKAQYLIEHPETANGVAQGGKLRPETGPRVERYTEAVRRAANEAGYVRGYGKSQVDAIVHRVGHFPRVLLQSLTGIPIPRPGLGTFIDRLIEESEERVKKGEGAMLYEEQKNQLEAWLAPADESDDEAKKPVDPVERDFTKVKDIFEKYDSSSADKKHLATLVAIYVTSQI